MPSPLVTILMPAYNAARTIQESLDSIRDGGVDDFELVLVDDASTDDTAGLVQRSYLAHKTTLIKLGSNVGTATALNIGLSHSRGKYVARLDADDLCLNERIAKQISFLEANEDTSFCGAHKRFFGGKDGGWRYPTRLDDCKAVLPVYCCYAASAVTFHRERTGASLYYNPAFDVGEDYDLYARLFAERKFGANQDYIGLAYRFFPESITQPKADRFITNDLIVKNRIFSGILRSSTAMPNFIAAAISSYDKWAFKFPELNTAARDIILSAQSEPHIEHLWPRIQNHLLYFLKLPEPPSVRQLSREECTRFVVKNFGNATRSIRL